MRKINSLNLNPVEVILVELTGSLQHSMFGYSL